MKRAVWFVQIFLALHTLMGALWKLSNSERDIPSLEAIPHGIWLSLSLIEILCTIALVLPLLKFGKKPWTELAPIAALVIAVEMLAYSFLHIQSGDPNTGPMIYWLVIAGISLCFAVVRFKYVRSS